VGANNPKLAGIYLQVSYVVISVVSIFVILAWNFTEHVWVAFGSDVEISEMAGYYATVLSISIPGQLLFTQLSQFFSAQRIMHPEVNASSFALLCNLGFGLLLVLGIPPFIPNFEGFGFIACPWVTTSAVYVQFLLVWYVYIHRQKLHEPCWGGWSLEEITWPRIKTFSHLYFPSAFGVASDFWRVAVIGTIAAKLGEEEVAIFNTSYRIMWIVLVMVMALAGASGINMSMRLGRMDSNGAKQAGHVGVGMASCISCLIGIAVWVQIRAFGRIFTNDEIFLDMFAEARTPFCITLVLMNIAVAIEKIPYSMGRTQGRYLASTSRFYLLDIAVILTLVVHTEVFWYGLIASWGFQVPAVYVCTTYWRMDLIGLYTGMALGYGVLVVLYSFIAFTR
jgi:MATE family multidrug resistance protein